ncbi:Replication factor C large subunit [uncultured archaeon]|nr:Replication factor C large subunit [uncultured archaeon]
MAGFLKAPKAISELVGSPMAFSEAKKWAQEWDGGRAQRPLLIYGPTGTGKTALAHAIAAEFGWDIFEFNASDLRDEASVMQLLPNATSSNSLTGARKLILIDDVDSLSGSADRRGASAIAKVLEGSRQPIILTALDYYDRKLSPVRAACQPLELRRVHVSSISSFLKKSAAAGGVALSEEDARRIAESVKGDIRAALNDLAARNFSALRDREKSSFDAVRTVLKSGKYSEAREASMSYEEDHNSLKTWIAHNVALEYERPYDLAGAYEALSRADVFDGRIMRAQHWGYLRYSSDLMTAGVAMAKTAPYAKYVAYGYPDIIRKMGSTKSARAVRKEVLRKVSLYCHCAQSQAISYLPSVAAAGKDDAEGVAALFGFEEEEMEFVSGKKKAKRAVRKKE